MTLSTALIFSIVFIIFFIFIMGTIAERMLKISAKNSGQNPKQYGILPNDLSSIFGRNISKPSYIPSNEDFFSFDKGFDIKLMGEASTEHKIESVHSATYAIKPKDFIGMMPIPKVVVEEGDSIKSGDILFYDKSRPEIKYAAPISGEMVRIQRGEKRSINEVVMLADKDIEYRQYDLPDLNSVNRVDLVTFLLDSGAWPFIRQRPFDIVADFNVVPKSIFVTTFDSAPLAPGFNLTVQGKETEFQKGLQVLAKLTNGDVHLGMDARGEKPADAFMNASGVVKHWFKGQHPAGNVGIHIHHVDPINPGETVWHLDVHGVLVLGTLFEKGIFDTERVVAITGYEIAKPRFVRAHQGICLEKLVMEVQFQEERNTTDKEGKPVNISRKAVRLISGDPLTGKEITSTGYLGFFDDQITTVEEGDYYELFGWLLPRKGHPTQNRTFPGGFFPSTVYKADTQQNGEHRAFVVSGEYESVLPMDIYPQYLLRAIQAYDFEKMEGLGILELGEEDVALCEYVCTSKHPVQKTLREGLNMLMEQG
ncbi:MAG: Na(+)-translocating NADH-quinone reductase subunit A [Saprospiraceae bacterium]|nr:Na(+)-translocating NADH-quinone reductase subunit A [Saprospiraceae bacterium]